MNVAIPREVTAGENRVAVIPETVRVLVKLGLHVQAEAGAGDRAFHPDAEYEKAGAKITADAGALFGEADLVLKIHPPTTDESAGRNEAVMLKKGAILVCVLPPSNNDALLGKLAEGGVTCLALDRMPRTTRAQSMDVLSSMSTLAGYKAAILAADTIGRMCAMMMTAAGTLRPVQALVIGAGVAGLQAIATAKRLGAVVTGVDVRPAVKEQIESLGARFVPMEVSHEAQDAGGYAKDLGEEFYRGEQEILAPHVASAGMIITTALIPGRRAPILITEAMVDKMAGDSVIVDLAVPAGGNCTLTRPDEKVVHGGVTIHGPTNLPSAMPVHASQMFSRNVGTFVQEFVDKEGKVHLDLKNQIIRDTLVTRDGQGVPEDGWPVPAETQEPAAQGQGAAQSPAPAAGR